MPALVVFPLALLGPVGWYIALAFCARSAHYER